MGWRQLAETKIYQIGAKIFCIPIWLVALWVSSAALEQFVNWQELDKWSKTQKFSSLEWKKHKNHEASFKFDPVRLSMLPDLLRSDLLVNKSGTQVIDVLGKEMVSGDLNGQAAELSYWVDLRKSYALLRIEIKNGKVAGGRFQNILEESPPPDSN